MQRTCLTSVRAKQPINIFRWPKVFKDLSAPKCQPLLTPMDYGRNFKGRSSYYFLVTTGAPGLQFRLSLSNKTNVVSPINVCSGSESDLVYGGCVNLTLFVRFLEK